MTTQFDIGIDWNRDGFICWGAQPGDALNLIPSPLAFGSLEYSASGTSPTLSLQNETTPYGSRRFNVATGTDTNGGIRFGQNGGSIDNLAVSASTTYTVKLWARGVSGYSGVDLKLEVLDQGENSIASQGGLSLSSDWQAYSLTFTTGVGDTHVRIDFRKDNDAADITYDVTGLLLVQAASAPSGFNAGNATDLYENVTDRTRMVDWFLGMKQAYQMSADDGVLHLTLSNADKRYSPENSGSPLTGTLVPYRQVQVQSDDGTPVRTQWVGWVEKIQPTVNQYGERTAMITAAGPAQFFAAAETSLTLQENQATHSIIQQLIEEVVIPPGFVGAWFVGRTGSSEIGQSTFLANTSAYSNLYDAVDNPNGEQGRITLALAADNWVRQGGMSDEAQDTFNVYRAIRDVVAAERGKFFFDRAGKAMFWNRHHLLDEQSADVTLNDDMQDLEYTYAGLEVFKNEIKVTCHPRTIGTSSDEVLWTLESELRIPPGDERTISVKYRDGSDNRIGAKNVTVDGVTFRKGTATVTLDARANGAQLTLSNSGSKAAIMTACQVKGQKITDYGRMEATAIDQDSIVDYGRRTMNLNLPSVDNLDDAEQIAEFEVQRRGEPRGMVGSVVLKSHGVDGGGQHAHQLARSIGDLVAIQETQTAHNKNYYLVGESHKLTDGAKLLETTWYLEPAPESFPWKLGVTDRSEVGETTVLTY